MIEDEWLKFRRKLDGQSHHVVHYIEQYSCPECEHDEFKVGHMRGITGVLCTNCDESWVIHEG